MGQIGKRRPIGNRPLRFRSDGQADYQRDLQNSPDGQRDAMLRKCGCCISLHLHAAFLREWFADLQNSEFCKFLYQSAAG